MLHSKIILNFFPLVLIQFDENKFLRYSFKQEENFEEILHVISCTYEMINWLWKVHQCSVFMIQSSLSFQPATKLYPCY